MAGNKFLKLSNGVIKEEAAIQSSAGAGDAGKIPALDASGKLDNSIMPTGIGTETDIIQASENLAGGDFVNIHAVGGAIRARKADATTEGKEANGFVLSAVTSGQDATVYRISQTNTALTGMTVGAKQYLSVSAGLRTETVPSGSGNVVQYLGVAKSATELIFAPNDPIVLA
jgi:hypothetical protein